MNPNRPIKKQCRPKRIRQVRPRVPTGNKRGALVDKRRVVLAEEYREPRIGLVYALTGITPVSAHNVRRGMIRGAASSWRDGSLVISSLWLTEQDAIALHRALEEILRGTLLRQGQEQLRKILQGRLEHPSEE